MFTRRTHDVAWFGESLPRTSEVSSALNRLSVVGLLVLAKKDDISFVIFCSSAESKLKVHIFIDKICWIC